MSGFNQTKEQSQMDCIGSSKNIIEEKIPLEKMVISKEKEQSRFKGTTLSWKPALRLQKWGPANKHSWRS